VGDSDPTPVRGARRSLIPGPLLAVSATNALAESFNGLHKAELIHQRPWRGLDDVEYETLEYIDWFNHRRLHGEIGMVPPAELEATHYHRSSPVAMAGTQ
jgi:putative transposase